VQHPAAGMTDKMRQALEDSGARVVKTTDFRH
jgi:hypothetical protein